MIKFILNGYEIDLNGDEDFAVTYEVGNDFKFHANNSVEISFPLTMNNLRAIENCHVIINDSLLPFNFITASVEVDGIDMKIEYAVLLSVSSVIKVKLYGGNMTMFADVKDKSIQELNLSAYDHTRNWAYIAGARNETEGIMYPIIDYGQLSTLEDDIEIANLYPAMFVHTLISKIASEIGYTLSGSLLTDPEYLKLIIPFCNKNSYVDPDVIASLLFEAYNPITDYFFSPVNDVLFPSEISDPLNRFDGKDYRALVTGSYTFHLKMRLTPVDSSKDYTVNLRRYDPYDTDPIMGSFSLTDFTDEGGSVWTIDADFPAIDAIKDHRFYISFHTENAVFLSGGVNNLNFSLVSITNTSVGYGEFWKVAPNLPDIKQGELIKYCLQIFSTIVQCDDATKTMVLTKIETIIENCYNGNSDDWSDLLDQSGDELTFKQNTAQINHLTYKDEDNFTKPSGTDYDLLISNKSLPAEKELYTAPFGASAVTQVFTFNQNVWRVDIEGASAIMPRILVSNYITLDGTYHYTYNGANQSTDTQGNVPYFITDSTFNLGFDNNLRQGKMKYSLDLLTSPKQLKVLIRLKPIHINTLDFAKPVWIDFYKCWFYKSKINQFKYGSAESTVCELIKLI